MRIHECFILSCPDKCVDSLSGHEVVDGGWQDVGQGRMALLHSPKREMEQMHGDAVNAALVW